LERVQFDIAAAELRAGWKLKSSSATDVEELGEQGASARGRR
jgi:hypothetical protein